MKLNYEGRNHFYDIFNILLPYIHLFLISDCKYCVGKTFDCSILNESFACSLIDFACFYFSGFQRTLFICHYFHRKTYDTILVIKQKQIFICNCIFNLKGLITTKKYNWFQQIYLVNSIFYLSFTKK